MACRSARGNRPARKVQEKAGVARVNYEVAPGSIPGASPHTSLVVLGRVLVERCKDQLSAEFDGPFPGNNIARRRQDRMRKLQMLLVADTCSRTASDDVSLPRRCFGKATKPI